MSYLTDKDWEDILADSSTLGKNQEVDEPSPERSCFEEPNQPNFFDSLLDDASTCEDHGITQASTPPTITQPETSTDAGQGSEVQGRDVFWEIDILKARLRSLPLVYGVDANV